MKELRNFIWGDLMRGFTEIQYLFSAFQCQLENLNGKGDKESLEEFLENQMSVLRSICDSHLAKMQVNLVKGTGEWRKKKEKDQAQGEEECVNQKRR